MPTIEKSLDTVIAVDASRKPFFDRFDSIVLKGISAAEFCRWR